MVGIGCISVDLKLDGDCMMTTIICDVYFVPNLDGNLLSISYLANFNLEVIFSRDLCRILDGSQLVGKGYKRNSLFVLAAKPCLENQMAYIVNGPLSSLDPKLPFTALATQKTTSEADIDIWHRQLGHINIQSILKLLKKGMIDGMATSDSKDTQRYMCSLSQGQTAPRCDSFQVQCRKSMGATQNVLRRLWTHGNDSMERLLLFCHIH